MNKYIVFIISLCVFLFSCEEKVRTKVVDEVQSKDYTYIDKHKLLLAYQDSLINAYVNEQGWEMERTATGLYYSIEPMGMNNKFPIGTFMELDYKIHRLNGELVYSSEETGLMQIVMNKDHSIKGLKEGIALMKEGKKARFILPSHLAYGISGDMSEIKVNEVLMYDIEIRTINNQKIH